ncbi:MAG TPA: class I SAM-dependent methyltransferase [Polyangiaceae bacterium]|nr:class I SAM-dependent methyltransferase [Polyangiaceae bacterium]
MSSMLLLSQTHRYGSFYSGFIRRFSRLRFDVSYRCRRLQTVLAELAVRVEGRRVLDVGFGAGDLLASFPASCELLGADVSASAVEGARHDPRFERYAAARFFTVPELHPEQLPPLQADIIVTSHLLEHVPNDALLLSALFERLAPGGTLAVFVPIEEPDYILFNRRNYSLQSIAERVEQAGFTLQRVEGSMYVNGHVWKLLTIPSRRRWPVCGPLIDALRMATLGVLPHSALERLDRGLSHLGVGARQALVIAGRAPRREG